MATITPDDLRRRREALGLSLSGLAERLDVDRMTVWRWEQGETMKSPAMLALALEALESRMRAGRERPS